MSREWLTLLIRRMDAVASVYRPGGVPLPRNRWAADAGGLSPQGPLRRCYHAARRPQLWRGCARVRPCGGAPSFDRLRAIAEYGYGRRPGTVLILTPSVWEQRLDDPVLRESQPGRDLRRRGVPGGAGGLEQQCLALRLVALRQPALLAGVHQHSGQPEPGALHRAAGAQAGVAARHGAHGFRRRPAFGLTPSEKRTLDLITDHPMIPREHLARWLGVSEGRVSQMLHNLVNAWGLLERQGNRGDVRYTLSEEGIRYVTHRDRAQLADDAGHLEHGSNHGPPGPPSAPGRGRPGTPTG